MIPHLSPWAWVLVGAVAWVVVIGGFLVWNWCASQAGADFDEVMRRHYESSTRSGGSPPLAGRVDPHADPDVLPSDEGSAAPAPHLPGAGASNDDTDSET